MLAFAPSVDTADAAADEDTVWALMVAQDRSRIVQFTIASRAREFTVSVLSLEGALIGFVTAGAGLAAAAYGSSSEPICPVGESRTTGAPE